MNTIEIFGCRFALAARFWLVVVLVATARAGEAAPPDASLRNRPSLQPMSAIALARAVAIGQSIRSRRVKGSDLAALMSKPASNAGGCSARSAIVLEDSVIDGPVTLERNVRARGELPKLDTGNRSKAGDGSLPRQVVTLPMAIRNSTITGDLSVSGLNLACPIDISGSRMEGRFEAVDSEIASLTADNATFDSEVRLGNANLTGSASFRGAEFKHNVEFSTGLPRESGGVQAVDFEDAIFRRSAGFIGVRFNGPTSFRFTRFLGETNFSQSKISHGPAKGGNGPFYQSEFLGRVSFRGANLGSIMFWKTTFSGPTGFDEVRSERMRLWGVNFRAPVDFTRARIAELSILGTVSASEDFSIRYASIGRLQLNRVTFEKTADFGGACFNSRFVLRKVAFKGDVRLDGSRLPPNSTSDCNVVADASSFSLDEVTFEKGLFMDERQFFVPKPWWSLTSESQSIFEEANAYQPSSADESDKSDQVEVAVRRPSQQIRRQWRELERGFQSAGNLSLQNFALYRQTTLEAADTFGVDMILDRFDRWFWGYGLRPMRVMAWLGVTVSCFALLYLTQVTSLGAKRSRLMRWWMRLCFAVSFSARTSLQPKYGFDRSLTSTFKVITAIQWVISVVLLTCLLYSISKTNPLANELLKKLLL